MLNAYVQFPRFGGLESHTLSRNRSETDETEWASGERWDVPGHVGPRGGARQTDERAARTGIRERAALAAQVRKEPAKHPRGNMRARENTCQWECRRPDG